MQPYYPAETGLNVNLSHTDICFTVNEMVKLRADVAAYALTFGMIMLVIGVAVGLILSWAIPYATKKINGE